MPRTIGDGGRRNVRRYVWKKRSSADKPKSRYVLQQRRAANDWACIPQSRRGFEDADWREEQAAAEAPGPRRSAPGGAAHRVYDAYDYGDYYEADEIPDDDYEPVEQSRISRSARARYRPADIFSLRTMGITVLIMLAAVIGGMVAEGRFGLLSALIAGAASWMAGVAGWAAQIPPTTLVGGTAAILVGAWMIAKAVRLQRTCYDEPAPRRRVLVSKETLDRYF